MLMALAVEVKPVVWNGDRGVSVPFVTLKLPDVIIGAAVISVIAPALPEPPVPEEVIAPVLMPVPVVAPAIMVTLPRLVFVVPVTFIEPGV